MKIGIDARFYHPRHSGNSRLQRELIKNLLSIDKKNQYIIFVTKEGAASFKDDFPKKPSNVRLVIFDYPHYSFAEQFKFTAVIKKSRLDLMHFAHINHPIFYSDPYIITMPDLILYNYAGKERFNLIKRWAYNLVMISAINKAKKIIAVSQNTKKELVEKLNASPDKIDVIYEGTDTKYSGFRTNDKTKRKILKRYGISQNYIIYLGQCRVHKNIPRLIYGFAKASQKGLKGQLVIVGRQDRSTVDLSALIDSLGMKGKIILTGFVPDEDLPYLYKSATAYAFPSLAEGFGLPPLEAMASKIPVISSNASCMPEVLGEGAVYFDPFSIEDIAQKINLIMTDGGLRAEMIKKGLAQTKKYSWKKMARQTLVLYDRINKDSKTQKST